MNGKQRIQMALAGQMPDRTPVMLHNFLMAIRENGYTVAQYRKNPRVIADVFCNTVEKYGVDGVLLEMDTALLAGCAGRGCGLSRGRAWRACWAARWSP